MNKTTIFFDQYEDNNLRLDKEKSKKMLEIINALDDLDDVQNIFTNVILDG